MKLIECYIAGFGALQDRSYRFDEGLSVFCQHNGAGKSTLAAFLKAMLYGMPSYKANSKGFEDRRHYFPFGGGAYGGSLTLSFQGETYCITRRFDAKSEVKDAMSVTCQGAPTDALGKIPGRTIFQVDSDSFERTAFFTADPGELAVGDVITFRLAEGTVVTHRIVEVLPGVDGPSYRTKGDANEVEDPTPVPAENVIGRVVWAVPRLGYLAAWLQTASGRYGVMAGGALLVLMLLLPDLLGVWTKRPEKGEGL